MPQVQVIPITPGRDCRLLSRCSEGSNKFRSTKLNLAAWRNPTHRHMVTGVFTPALVKH